MPWLPVCKAAELAKGDVVSFRHNGQGYAIYHTRHGFFATDDMCTHERALLSEGLVVGDVIECPLHQGRFDIRSGRALSPPVCIDLKVHLTKVEAETILIFVSDP